MIRRLLEKWLGVVELRKQLVTVKEDLLIAKYLGKITDTDIQDYKYKYKYKSAPYHTVIYRSKEITF